jgi:DNA-directed RNA polymerase subunit RPC12/RpoP
MAFDIRCPECQAKLRLDEAPDRDTPIECPRCGSQFTAPRKSARAERAAPKEKKKFAKGDMPKKRKAKKHKTNPIVLVLAIVAGFGTLIGVGFLMVYFLNRAGKVEEMLTYVPDSCNWARGVNVSQLAKYPGYKGEVSKYMTEPVTAAAAELAAAAGHDPERFVDYLVIAKNRGEGRGVSTMYVFRTQRSFAPDAMMASLSGGSPQGDGTYKMSGAAPGILAGATVHMPTTRLVVVIPPGAASMVSGSMAGKNGKGGTFAGALDATARTVIRGSIWLVVRATGGLQGYIAGTTGTVANYFKHLDTAGKAASTFGVWTTPGGSGVRVGAAMQCASSQDASELVTAMREGPLGKADESEPTNELKKAWGSITGDKKAWSEFMQYLEFRSKRECAYIVSTVSGDNAKRFLDMFNSPNMATGEGGGFGMPGGGGMPRPEGGGPPGRGLPGGIAPPGGVGP